ncbi:MAG TPA: hypothetical protein VF530_04185 [Planctomycetota bacterium]
MRWFLALFLCAAHPVVLATQDVPAEGHALSAAFLPPTTPLAATLTLRDGGTLTFDGLALTRHASDGSLLAELGSVPLPVFPSFLCTDPEERTAYFGESSNGHVYRLSTGAAGTPELLATLPFNYDAAQRGRYLYVSAATCGFACDNEIWRIDLAAHRSAQAFDRAFLLAHVPGASGPLTTTASGELIYASVSSAFPPPPGHASLWRWSRDEAEGAQLLALADAELVASGFEGAARLAHDPLQRCLYLAEVDFATGTNRIRRVRDSASLSPVLLEGRSFFGIGSLTFHASPGPARFRPFQPASGGVLSYTTTDFFSTSERLQLRPQRPVAVLEVPMAGSLRIALAGGPAGGSARVLMGPRALVPAEERALAVGGLPLFLGLDRATQTELPGLFALDPAGELALDLPDPGGTAATLAFQLLLYDGQGALAGSSTVGLL